MHNICYVDILKLCNLKFLDLRCVLADLIMLNNIFNESICINLDNCIYIYDWEHYAWEIG